MKKFFALFALILVAAIPLCLVGCKSKYDNLSIEMESSYEIVLGESSDDSITIEARVSGGSDENGGRLNFSPDNDKLVKISQEYKNGINYITLKALAPGKVNIEARTLEGGVTKTFVVNIIQPIKNFTVKSGDFWVIRGGEWKIDVEKNLNLEPTNTTQTDFVVSFGTNQDISGLEIENNILKVARDSIQDEIVLNVQSASNSDIAPKEIKLEVLDELVEIDKETQETQSRFDDGDVLIFEKNESMLTYNKLEELNIISNLLSESEKEVVVRVYSSREVDVDFESNSRLAVKKISSSKTYKTNGQVEYTDFVFSVRFADTVSSGTTTSLNFVASYVGFELKKQLSEITVAYELAPKTILVNDQEDLTEFTLYNFYSIAKKGQKLQFGVLPTSVSLENSKMVLLNKDNFENVFDCLQFFRNNGEELFEGDTINAGEIVYARAKSDVRTGSFEVLLQTKFVNPQTNAPISKILRFNVLSGITEMNFENDEQINLQLNSAQNSAEILLDVAPANIDITKIHVEEVSGLAFSTIAVKSQTAEGLTLRFVVSAKNVGNYRIKVYSENGIEITKNLKVVNALESVVLSVPSPNENSVVGDRQIIGGELRYVAVSLGGAIPLEENILPNNSSYRVEYSYFEVDSMPEYALSSYDYPNLVASTSVGVLDYSQLLGYKKIVALKQGYTVIRAKYIPIGIENNQSAELEPIYKYFVVQAYKPIRTIVMSSNYATLYSLKSVGVFNKHQTMTKIQLSVYPNDATYANSIVWDYDNSGEYFVFDEENLTVSAIKRYAGTISIVATIKELNRTYTQTLSITILDAKMVSDISVVGIGDSIYIENVDETTKTFNINAVAFPNDAYNTKLRYDFVDQSGNIVGDIKISNDGIMTIPAGIGLSGYVRIAAEDCFQENSSTGEYQPVGVEGKNIILIPTLIANGTSKETAISINSKEELQKIDTKKHYKIQKNLDVSGISFENFSGGLYGYDSESRVVLSGFDRTFIQTLAKTGRIEDLQIDGDINLFGENGILVGKNAGYINNVVATGNWNGSLSLVGVNAGRIFNTTSEVVFEGEKFGGIALSNNGEIYNCSFMGSITASNQAAGIVISNSGLLEVCSTLLLDASSIKLASTFDPQAKLAGLCVENLENGRILRSYIHSYKADAAFADSDFSHAGGFVHTNSGEITKSFSALLYADSVTGFVYVNNSKANIENCYSNTTFANYNYGLISKCFSVLDDERLNASTSCYSGANATEKTVSDWLKTDWDISCTYEKITIWKIYLDSQNPYLREISAEVKPESMIISVKDPQNTNSYLKLNETQVLLYRYESQVSPLTTAEKTKLDQYNRVSIYDLLSFEILPYDASSSPDMFNYSLTEGSALSISGLYINVLGLGKQTLTITSKLNPELSFTLDIYTSYPIRDFNIFASSSSFDPSGALSDDSVIYLKRTYTQVLYSKIASSVVLVDREIEFKTHEIKINYADATEPNALGLYFLKFIEKQTINEFVCSLSFVDVSLYEAFEEIKSILPNYFTRTFKVIVYNGAESLFVSQNSFEMEPIDTISLEVTLTTDIAKEYFDNNYSDEKQKGEVISYQVYNDAGVNLTDYFEIDYELLSTDNLDNDFYVYKVELTIKLLSRTTQISGNYYIRIYANEEYSTFGIAPVDVAIKLLPQSLQRIDYSHYYAASSVEKEGEKLFEVLQSNPSPSNSLAPGQVGLLEVNLFPTYSEISHVEIESIPNQDFTVKLQLYRRYNNQLNRFTMVQQNTDYTRTENGIIVGYTMINNGTIYVKTQVDSNIPAELTFELVVRAYRSKQDQNPIEQHIYLAAKFIPTATVEVDGQKDYVVIGRGTTKDMTITVVGEGDVEIFAKDDADSGFVYERAYVGQKTLTGMTNLGTKNQYVYTCPIFVGSKFKNDNQDIVRIEVVVSREVNGVREKKTTTLIVRVLDFVVNKVVLTNGTDKYNSKVSVKTVFDFSYDITEPQSFTNEKEDTKAVENLKATIKNFKDGQYFRTIGVYEKTFMFIDPNGDEHKASTGDKNTSGGNIYQSNDYLEFEDSYEGNKYLRTVVKGLKTGTQRMKFKVSAYATTANESTTTKNEIYSLTYEFDVVVTNYSNEDKPMPIGSLEDFNAIFEQSDAQDYILTNDIEIGDHTPYSDTSKIRSLDGNNHKITIKSLSIGTDQTLVVALFNTINETTTIKNLIVDYQIGEINANSSQFSSISAAGLAINNEGIVTNTHVLSMKNSSTVTTTGGIQISSSVSQSTQIEMAGFVLNNSGSITNSRVGDSSVTIVNTYGHSKIEELKVFALVGQDQMAGFVLNNTGIISASYAKNITIVNNSQFETNSQTAGFVLNNQTGAKIVGSYVRGVEGNNKTDIHVEGQGIESAFEVAGFVYDNFSYISDCYSNIKLYKETSLENRKGVRSAGFVYKNELGAQIVSSLSLSKIIEDDTSQEQFCGVDSQNQSNNLGTITYSYYYSKLGKLQSVADGAELLNATAVAQKDRYYGYSFTTLGALDGMWTMTTRGPELVSANNIALSKRDLISAEEDNYDVAYVAGFEYGSINNPILIRSAQEFNDVFGTSKEDSVKKYFDSSKKQAFGNYRIINDIDLSDLSLGGSDTTILSSTSYTFMRKTDDFGSVIGHGILEGNSMTISNLDFSITDTDQIYFGLFSSIKNGAVVKNLNLTVKEISASNVNYVGALAGYVEDSKIINVSAEIAQNQQVALIQGRNIVGGVVGAVAGTSELNNITSNISAHATYVDSKGISEVNKKDGVLVQAAVPTLPTEGTGLNSVVSIAGSVAGAIYAKDINNATNANLSTIDYAQVQKIKASGKITVSGKIVGGLVGYVGKTTYLHDAWLAISDGQNINAHNFGVAGGAVGFSYGKLSHIRVEHNDVQDYTDSAENLQKEIEENVQNYYESKSNERKTYENMFNSTNVGQTLGGIVGIMNGGYLEDSYTKLDVISDAAYNLGGIVGIAKNQKYFISRVYTFSNVQSKSKENNIMVGGLFGAVLSTGELDTVVGANYLDKNYTTTGKNDNFVTFVPFAGACSYQPSVMKNVYTLGSLWAGSKSFSNAGAQINSAKTVVTLTTTLGSLFPASENSLEVNDVFEIDNVHFKNVFWARNVDDVFPHLTFGLEEQYFIIDNIDTANDIRKMLKNSNKTFYIKGEVSMTSDAVVRAVREVRESIIFTGNLLGATEEIVANYDPSQEPPTLVGMEELFNYALGATFADFTIKNPRVSSVSLPSTNYGSLVGKAKDCSFRKITLKNSEDGIQGSFDGVSRERNVGGLVGLAEGKSSYEEITVSDIEIKAGGDTNIGLIVGRANSTFNSIIFKNCSVKKSTIISLASDAANRNTNVGGIVGLANGVSITNNIVVSDGANFDEIFIDVAAPNVGGLVGNCTNTASINSTISKIQVNVRDVAVNVGGLVGQTRNLHMTISKDINLDSITDSSNEENYGKIEATGETVNFGGVVGQATSVSISAANQTPVRFQTNGISVSGSTIYAGGLVGLAGELSISNVQVNTQGKIKNKVMTIACAGDVTAGGLVGKATRRAIISDCWSGTDVEINGSKTKSNIAFGGIIGIVNYDSHIETPIARNVSYGRFFIASNDNPTSINAGGIAGSITTAQDISSKILISDNKTLTSLEIRRHATGAHNVNAVVGKRNSEIIGGSRNLYTYQLSLAVESDTGFAPNCNTMSGVGVSDENATEGSILRPIEVKADTMIIDGRYYSISAQNIIRLTFPTWQEGETEKNFVIAGNGNTISIENTHIDTIGSRTILSGLTIGEFKSTNYSVTRTVEITLSSGKVSYEYTGTSLKPKSGNVIPFGEIRIYDEGIIQIKSEDKPYSYFEYSGKEIRLTNYSNYNDDEIFTITDVDGYFIYIGNKAQIQKINNVKYIIEIDGIEYELKQDEDGNMWLEGSNATKIQFEKITNENDSEDITYSIKIGENTYIYNDETNALENKDASGNIIDKYSFQTTYDLNDIKGTFDIKNDRQDTRYYVEIVKGFEQDIPELGVGETTTINGETYECVKDTTQNALQLVRYVNMRSVTIGKETFVKYGDKFFSTTTGDHNLIIKDVQKGSVLTTISMPENGGGFNQESGFVTTNNGYISGVVVFANYSVPAASSNVAGFVATNNGVVVYSSFNGHVYRNKNKAERAVIAGFVYANNGIIDYCHSTGAVQGETDSSYSFGLNAETGSLTNCYTISLNEANVNSENKHVFGTTQGVKFENNEYDPIATEIDLGEMKDGEKNVISNKLVHWFENKSLSESENVDRFWELSEIKGGEIIYNYGYKTLSAGAFSEVSHLKIQTGIGTPENPYLIPNSRLLTKIDDIGTTYSYSLVNNINLSKNNKCENWGNIGLAQTYNGTFEGNNKTISNLSYKNYQGSHKYEDNIDGQKLELKDIDSNKPTNNYVYGGLFAKTENAIIRNLYLSNVQIDVVTTTNDSSSNKHSAFAGALAGEVKNSQITNVVVLSTNNNENGATKCRGGINAEAKNRSGAGGLVGYVVFDTDYPNAKIENCVIGDEVQINAYNNFANNQEVDENRASQMWVGFSSKDDAKKYQAYAGGIVGFWDGKQTSTNNKVEALAKNITAKVVDRHEYFNQSSTVAEYKIGGKDISLNLIDLAPQKIKLDATNDDGLVSTRTSDYVTISRSDEIYRYFAYYNESSDWGNNQDKKENKYYKFHFKVSDDKICVGGNGTDGLNVSPVKSIYNWAGVVWEKNGYDSSYCVINNSNRRDPKGGEHNITYKLGVRKAGSDDPTVYYVVPKDYGNDCLIAYMGTYEKTTVKENTETDDEWLSSGQAIWIRNFLLLRDSGTTWTLS